MTEWRGGAVAQRADWIAEEVPVALVVNGISHAVMLASPCDLDDFALGFALTEGLVDTPAGLYGVEAREVAQGIELQLEVSSACAWRLKERRRTLAGRTGCGLCGTDSLRGVPKWCRGLASKPVENKYYGIQAVSDSQHPLQAYFLREPVGRC